MDVFLMIQRKKLTIFTDTKDDMTIYDLKDMISYIIHVPAQNQQLYYKDKLLHDEQTLSDCGIIATNSKAHNPANIGLALRMEDGNFEALEIEPYSTPPDVSTFMKNQESSESSEQSN